MDTTSKVYWNFNNYNITITFQLPNMKHGLYFFPPSHPLCMTLFSTIMVQG